MPYIPKDKRAKYNGSVDELASILNSRTSNDELSGDMNYVLFRLALLLTNDETGGQHKYARMAVVRSALDEARAEFKRRCMDGYEDEAIERNGDVEV
jgi:hypothetical protein